jgi:xylose dehydrogenase (NAD/NADP)
MNSDQKLRWGVLGYARIAREVVMPAIERAGNSRLQALGSRDASKLAAAKEKFPALSGLYPDYDSVLRDPAVDAVYIPLPNALHHEWVLRAAAAGKHVLCEKPLGLTAVQVREMISAAERHGVTLMEAFMYRYTERTRAVQEVLRAGSLGEIRQVNATFRFLLANPASIKLRPELGGGSLYDVGCYPVNFIGMVADAAAGGAPGAGGQPASVAVECVREGGIDMAFSALLRYESGLMATVNCGFNAHFRVGAEIIGRDGVLEIPDTFLDPAGGLVLTRGSEKKEIPVPASDRYRAEIEDFASAVQGKRAPKFSLVESLRNAEVIDRLLAAMA